MKNFIYKAKRQLTKTGSHKTELFTQQIAQRTIYMVGFMRGLAVMLCSAVLMLGLSLQAHATSFTETVPNGNGPIPSTYPPVGGTMFVLIGANGNIYYQFVNPSTQFEGFQLTGQPAAFRGNPFQLGPQQSLNCGPTDCVDYFGGSIVEGYARLTARDGDACPGNFDFNDVFFEVNGIRVGSFTGPQTERTSRDGTTSIGFENCFRNQGGTETSTAWFDLTPVGGLLNNILATGGTTPFVFDNDGSGNGRGDNFWFFGDGEDATGTPEVAPGVRLTKTANISAYQALGDLIEYSFLVENIGSVTLTNIVVTDAFITGTITCPQTSLLSAENMTCTAQHIVTQANIDDDVVFTNRAEVTAVPTEGTLGAVSGTVTIPGPAADNRFTLTKQASNDTDVIAGETITYTYVVENLGNVTLDNVNVTDAHGGTGTLGAITPVNVTLAPSESQSFTADYVVTQADVDASGVIANTATAAATPRRGALNPITAVEEITPIAPAPNATLAKSASQDANLGLGDTVTYTYLVTNTGNITLNNVSISDAHGGTQPLGAITPANVAAVAPGATASFTADYVITQADIDAGTAVSNTATLNATPASGTLAPQTATEEINFEAPAPLAEMTKTASDTTNVAAGDVLTYTYEVINTGNVTLTNLSLADNHSGTGALGAITPATFASLPVGQTATFTANYTVTQADVDAGADITNIATLTATPARGTLTEITADEAVDVADAAPELTMVKTATQPSFTAVGDVIDYTYEVTNSGNVEISGVSVTDDRIASVTCPAGAVAPLTSVTCTAQYTITQADLDAGEVVNNAEATGTPAGGTLAPATAQEIVDAIQSPELRLTKTALDTDFTAIGDTLDYEYLVENTGNVEITALAVTDDQIATISCPVTTLAPSAQTTCTGTHTVTQANLDAGQIINNAEAGGTPAGGTLTPATGQATVGGTQAPALSIDKSALTGTFTAVGDVLDYEYVVTNTGNVTITEPISVDDDRITIPQIVNCPALPSGGLPVNGTITCRASYSVTQADIDAGEVINIASATDGTAVSPTDQATVTATQTPELDIVKAAVETSFAAVGDSVNYTYTVTNTGNVLIADLVVTDDLISNVSCNVSTIGNGDANLDPTEEVVCTGLYEVTQADLDAGSVTNIASVSGTPAGGTLAVPETSATVNADQTPENLDPSEIVICTGSDVVTQADLDAGEVVNTAEVTGTPAGGTLAPAGAEATVDADQTPSLETVKIATNVNFERPGDITTYEYVVTNTGNVTMTAPITVTDNLISNVTCPALPAGGLAPAASLTCSGQYAATQADLDVGAVTNLAFASDGTTTSPQTSETIPADQNPALSVTKTALFSEIVTAGEVVQYAYEVSNDGNLTLTGGVDVVDDKIGTINCVVGNLTPNTTQTCTADYTVTQADIDAGFVMNQAFAQNGALTSAPVDVTVNATQRPVLEFVKRATSATFVNAGDVLNYEFDVTNSGNVSFTNVAVNDNLIRNVSCPQNALAPSASMICTGSYTVTQADVDAGEVVNNASAGATPPNGPALNTPSSVTVDSTPQPSFTFAKRAVNANFTAAGDILNYEFDVANTGSVTLSNIVITDNLVTTISCPATTLAPSASTVCTANYTVTQADVDAGEVVNNASADADTPDGTALPTAPSSATVDAPAAPSLDIVKTALDTEFSAVGDVLDYSYLVENTGNVTISGISVTDDLIPSLSCSGSTLAPAATLTCTGSYTVTQADIDSGSVTNVAAAGGTPAGGTLAPASDNATVNADQAPALEIVKTALTADFDRVGDTLDYEYVVTNTGNTTLTSAITVSDDRIASVSCPSLPAGGLAPQASLTCSATYLVTQADLDAGDVTNIASASDGTTTSPTDDATVEAQQAPELTLAKTASDQTYDAVGDVVSYDYLVTNTGNVSITAPLSVTDNQIASVTCPALPTGGLAPNASVTCTGQDTITQADLDAGSLTNSASVSDGTVTSPSVDETVTADQAPALGINKVARGGNFQAAGDVITYDYTVTNTGNVTITTPVTVADDRIAAVTCPVLPGGALAPSQSLVCSADYTVTQADVDAGSVTNIASASSGGTTSPSASETVDADQAPALSVEKTALETSFTDVGDVLNYNYLVRNTGNITINQALTIADDRIANVVCPSLPAGGFVPNTELVCSATYVVTQADIDAGDVTNIASASSGGTTSAPDDATVAANQAPSLKTLKRALETTFDTPGDVIAYEYDVFNNGNVTITAPITVADDRIANVNCPALPTGGLVPDAFLTCTASYSVTQADIDAGEITNIASATDGTTTSPDVSRTVVATRTPGLDIVKTATNINFALPGDVTTYEYVVTNSGNVTITEPILVNDNLIPNTVSDTGSPSVDVTTCPPLPVGGLAPGQSITCIGMYETTQDNLDVGAVTNVASATDGTTTSSLASETIPANQNPALAIRKSSTNVSFDSVGDVLTYTFEIENTGNVTLTGSSFVVDNRIGEFVCFTGNLTAAAPGNIQTCQATYTVTQADLDAGDVTNDAFAMHPRASSAPDTVTIPAAQTPSIGLVKTPLTADFTALGDSLEYEYVVTNTGNTTLIFPVDITDNRIPNVNCPPLPVDGLAPAASLTCTATDTVSQADIDAGFVDNTAIANSGPTTSAPQTARINGTQTPAMTLVKVANDNDFAAVGDVLDYTFIVTNSGNITLTSAITIDDSRIGTVTCPALPTGGLGPNQTLTCQASDTVTQADIDAGQVTNRAFATDGTTSSLPQDVTVTGTQAPSFSLVKTANETQFTAVGDTLSYDYLVTNTGNVTLTSAITVSDDRIANVVCPALPATGLAPNGTLTCEGTDVVTQADIDAGQVTNVASATDGTTTSPDATVTVAADQAPALSVAKTATITEFAAPGDQITYDYVVTNAGNITLTSAITVSDDRIAAVSCPALPEGGLVPSASLTCTGVDTVTQADIDLGQVVNTASASDGTTTSAPVSETVIGEQTNAFTVDKVALSNDFTAVGDVLSYNYIVRNTGNVSITDAVTIEDDKIGTITCPALPSGGLAPNMTLTCSADYVVIQADIDASEVTNVAFAVSNGERSAPDTVTVTGTQAPALSIVKSSDAENFTAIGDTLSYTYLVTNTGNVTLTTAITVADDRIAAVTCPALPNGGLAPAASLTCSADYTVTQADIDAGQVTNIASASDGTTTSDPDTVTIDADISQSLAIVKRAITEGFNAVGDVISYEYDVTNTGNATLLEAVTIADDKIANVTCPALPSGGLAPQASLTCAADYTAVQADIDAGSVTNIASATAGNATSPETDATVDAMRAPELIVQKSITDTLQVGGPIYDITYQITMENTGNVTLTNVQLQDDLAQFLAPATIFETPVVNVSGFTNGSANSSYNGESDINMLTGSPSLPVGDIGVATILVRIDTTNGGPVQGNTAFGSSDVLGATVPSNDPSVTPNAGDDINPTPLSIIDTDGDGSPDNFESATADRDGDGIPDSEDFDPTGYFFCEENGDILSGGGISVTGPAGTNASIGLVNNISIVQDGSDGFFQFFVTQPGRYTLTPTYPVSGIASTERLVQDTALDATSLLPANPAVLGSSEFGDTGRLADASLNANPRFYFVFDIEAGDPAILMNNIPLRNCGVPGLSVSKTVQGEPEILEDGRQLVTYDFLVENTGETVIEDIQVTDDLGSVFGADRVEVVNNEITQGPLNFSSTANPAYNGVSNQDMLAGNGDLLRGQTVNITLQAVLNPETDGEFINTASVTASAPLDGAALTATSSASVSLLPLSDPALLNVVKTAQPRTVQIGDPILYNVTVTNESASTMSDLRITDRLPEGFAYIPNTATINDATTSISIEPEVASRGVLTWTLDQLSAAPLDTLEAGESLTVSMRVLAGPNVEFGAHENQAFVESIRTGVSSNVATAVVDYIPEPTFDCTPVIGRVYDDVNHNGYPDDGEPGLPAVRLVTVNGDIITTDEHGRYHIPCAIIANNERGSNFLLKADTRTLPLGYNTTTENPRVVRATRGKFVKMNFGAAHRPKLRIDLFTADFDHTNNKMYDDAANRVRNVLAQSTDTQRAILVYHADGLEPVDMAQRALDVGLNVVRGLAPKQFKDIALEASWGDAAVFEARGDSPWDAEARPSVGQLFADDLIDGPNTPNNRDRIAFIEGDDGDLERSDFDRLGNNTRDRTNNRTSDIEGDRFQNREAGLRGGRGSEALSSDTRRPTNRFGGRRDAELGDDQQRESARPGRLRRWIGWGDKTTSYAEGMEIETTTDSLDPIKRLNAQANIVGLPSGRFIRAEGYWNYDAFISRLELRVFDARKSTRSDPMATARVIGGEANIPVTENMPQEMIYVLRATAPDGSFDETAPKTLRLGEAEFDLTEDEWANEAHTAFGQNTLLVNNITVRGGSVRVYGRNVAGDTVQVLGQTVAVDEDGKFIIEQLLPAGTQSIDIVADGKNGKDAKIIRSVDVKSKGIFYAAQIESTVGQNIAEDADGNRDFQEGRVAFYVRARLSDKIAFTATADTGEASLGNLISGLDDKDVGQLLRRLDPDRFYPTYGDDSVIEQDAPTSGRVYARLERDDDYVLWGNYQTNFNDTEFARVRRTLYGAKFNWDQNGNPTKFGDDRTRITAYVAEGGTLQGRDEFRGTGGSVYFLRRGDISIGSELLRIETRDSVSGLVIESRRLTYGVDYDLDFIQGRVILNRALGSTSDDGRLFRDGSQSGNETLLVADYEFTPVLGANEDAAIFGVRGSRWFGDHLKLGATYNRDADGGSNTDLFEVDLTLQYAAGIYIKGEFARTEGAGIQTFRSIDGGFSFNAQDIGGLQNDSAADGYALEAAVDFSEIDGINLDGNSYAYWRRREAGFAGLSEATNQTIEQFGGGIDLNFTRRLGLSARADVTDDVTIGTNSFAEARITYELTDKFKASGGLAFSDDAQGRSGTSFGGRVDYTVNDDNKVYVFGQVGIEGDNTRTTDRIGAGGELRLTKNIIAGGEVSTGEDGLGARASVRYQYEDGDENYLAYDFPLNAQIARGLGTANLGVRRRYGDALSVFGEERLQFNDRGVNGLTHAYGVEYKPGNWNLGLSGEVGEVDNLDRQAFSANIGFSDERLSAGVTGEWREDENTETGDERRTWLLRATARYQASDELRLQGKFNFATSEQSRDGSAGPVDFNEAEFTEASIAAAYRPIWDDRFNLLAKITWLEDLSPTSQTFNGETLDFRQRSRIASVDASYDLTSRFTLGAKYGYRSGDVTSDRESDDFFRSEAQLGVLRLDYHATHQWDAVFEGRILDIGNGTITREGGLFGLYRHLNDNAKIGAGVTFGGIEEEYLAAQEEENLGWFINVVGKF